MSQFEPESGVVLVVVVGGGAFSVCASSSSPLFRSESVSESPEGARHGTATSPARAREKRVVGREGEADGRGRGGGELDRIRSPMSAVATTGGLFAREHIRCRRLLARRSQSAAELRLDQRQQKEEVEPLAKRMLPSDCSCCLISLD